MFELLRVAVVAAGEEVVGMATVVVVVVFFLFLQYQGFHQQGSPVWGAAVATNKTSTTAVNVPLCNAEAAIFVILPNRLRIGKIKEKNDLSFQLSDGLVVNTILPSLMPI